PHAALAVERREAQRPGGGPRKPATAGRARLGMGLANPSGQRSRKPLSPARRVSPARSQGRVRGLANPWRLPALHLSSESGNRDRATRALAETGSGALPDASLAR